MLLQFGVGWRLGICELMVNDPLRIERLEARIIELEEEVAGLRERLGEAEPGPARQTHMRRIRYGA